MVMRSLQVALPHRSRRKVGFSGAARHANEAAGAAYSAVSGGESAETGLGGEAGWIRTLSTDYPVSG
jgi:hypothetical protein